MQKTEKEWKEKLSEGQFRILREKGTEAEFSGKYWNYDKKGEYVCAGCGAKLFSSNDKFDCGDGWPSFTKPIDKKSVEMKKDFKLILPRTEVLCSKCGGHLGHVFNDGLKEKGGKRYCVNSEALGFKKE